MSNHAKDLMTADPQCCTAETPLNEVAKLMVECDCGEIPVVDDAKKLVGVVTDRDIVCRVVAKGQNPSAMTAQDAMSHPVISVTEDATLEDVLAKMEEHQVRRLPVVDASGGCCGIISQADVAMVADESETGEMVREVSRDVVAN
ncbi:MAG: CBS domain-containing protein [Acidobacteriota bacterium]|nr:CBS domain-containing protein [Acidobacteriota bacterium]